LISFVRVLAAAMDAGDPYTHGRAYRCSRYAVCLGRRFGVVGPTLVDLELAGLLVDLGKKLTLHSLHAKPGPLDDEQKARMEQHAQIASSILFRFPWLRRTALIISSMNERYDGRGVPEKLEGIQIPLPSRILAVVSALDAMLSDRPHRAAMSPETAYAELRQEANRRFDARVVEAVIALHESGALAREIDKRVAALCTPGEDWTELQKPSPEGASDSASDADAGLPAAGTADIPANPASKAPDETDGPAEGVDTPPEVRKAA
jgi:HD-GYP domain-containing protein (c-di-GMP phosphodiesterase class II)